MHHSHSFVRFVLALLATVSFAMAAPIKFRRPTPAPVSHQSRSIKSLTDTIAHGLKKHIERAFAPPIAKRAEDDTLGALFPVEGVDAKWTTLEGAPGALPLSDQTLRPHHVASGTPYTYVTSHGKKSVKAHYPKGSYKPSASPQGGISFYAPGPASVDLSTAREATFGYSVMFPEGFEFVKGGKLPGLYGGNDDQGAVGCSGGRRDGACFSARLMWRENGQGELYTYLPPFTDSRFAANEKLCEIPNSDCNETYGASLSRGSFSFKPGQWTTVSQRVKLNSSPTKADGELELFVSGQSVINISGLILRDSTEGRIRGIQMQTFFGGSTTEWATPKDQDVFFADLSVGIISTF